MKHARHAKPRSTVRRSAGAAGALGLFTAATGALWGPVPAAQAQESNLIENGSFEEPAVSTGTYDIFPSIPGIWTSTNGIEIQHNLAGAPAPGAGDQFVELGATAASTISQTVPTVVGKSYRLAFIYSPRPDTAAAENRIAVSAGPAVATVSAVSSPGPATAWTTFTLDFIATAATTTVSLADVGVGLPDLGAYVDEVALSPIEVDCSAPAPAGAIVGTDGGNVIDGTMGDDVIFGLGGGDVINGRGGDDVICGGTGGDVLRGGNGDDVLDGGVDGDSLYGGNGQDTLRGGDGEDYLDGGDGLDTNDGGAGANVCTSPANGPGC